VFKAARERAGLRAAPERRGGVDRLTVEEELRFLDQAYAQDGRTGLMLQTLLETGARASELVQLRVEDVSLAERVVTIRDGKGGKRREVPIRRDLAHVASAAYRHAASRAAVRQPPAGIRPDAACADPPTRWPGRPRRGRCRRDHQARLPPPAPAHGGHPPAWLGMDITDLQRFLGHGSIATIRLYAETTAATLQRSFDQLTDPAVHALIAGIRQQRGDDAALIAADLLARRRAERVSTAGA